MGVREKAWFDERPEMVALKPCAPLWGAGPECWAVTDWRYSMVYPGARR
jgi:hypothetical protein